MYCLDLREHGESPHTREMTFPLMAQDVERFAVEHEIPNLNLLGHSMGGKVAMHLAHIKPTLLNKLIVVDISPGTLEFSTEIPTYVDYMLEIKNQHLDPQTYLTQKIRDPSIVNFLQTNYKNGKCRLNLETIKTCLPKLNNEFKEFECNLECLFIRGNRSNYIPLGSPLLKQYFPNSRVVSLDAGHWVHAEKPLEFTQTALQFLNE